MIKKLLLISLLVTNNIYIFGAGRSTSSAQTSLSSVPSSTVPPQSFQVSPVTTKFLSNVLQHAGPKNPTPTTAQPSGINAPRTVLAAINAPRPPLPRSTSNQNLGRTPKARNPITNKLLLTFVGGGFGVAFGATVLSGIACWKVSVYLYNRLSTPKKKD